MVVNTADNRYATANFIVAPTLAEGANFTTITAALAAASSPATIFIKPGTYTENLTLKAGVNLTAYECDALTPNVTIIGNATHNTAGTVSISGIRLQTNSAAFLTVSGSAASVVNLSECYLNCTNNTGISFSSSSSSSQISLNFCNGNIGTTGIALFSSSSNGDLSITFTTITNSGNSTTASTISSGNLGISYSFFTHPITSSGTANVSFIVCLLVASNTTFLTHGGSGPASAVGNCGIISGNASAISVSSSLRVSDCFIVSTNANAITGAGTLNYDTISFSNTGSSEVNVTTQTANIFRPGITRSISQPAFLATSAGANNVTGDGTVYTVVFGNEIFDQNNNFDGTSTFTAPYTGRYQLNTSVVLTGLTGSHTTGDISIVTSNRTYSLFNGNFGAFRSGFGALTAGGTVLADMDAGDTAVVQVTVSNGTLVVDIFANTTTFSGHLVC